MNSTSEPTNNESHLAVLVIKTTGHHGGYSVVDQSQHVNINSLKMEKG